MDFAKAFAGDVRVNLGCCNIGMSKHCLNAAQISPPFQQMRCKGVAQGMGRNRLSDPSRPGSFFEKGPKGLSGESPSSSREKDKAAVARLHQLGPPLFQITTVKCQTAFSERNNAVLRSFSGGAQVTLLEVDLFGTQLNQLETRKPVA